MGRASLGASVRAGILLAAIASAGVAEAQVTYWAFGDSVTRGEGGGIKLDDAAGTICPSSGYPTKCGYHWRLEDALDTAGVSSDVLNRGLGGETTAAGLSRISGGGEPLATSRCSDASADDVLLLMLGTNDVSVPISLGTIVANLAAMMGEAKDKCVHTVIATTIRRLKGSEPMGSVLGEPNHSLTRMLKNEVVTLSASLNRELVHAYSVLCPDQPCYGTIVPDPPEPNPPADDIGNNFHPKFVGGDPGHVNKTGYDLMAPLFETAILGEVLPPAPAPTAPSGDITDGTPLFSWPELTPADWYFLQVQEADGTPVYGWWHPQEGHDGDPVLCVSSVCSFDPGSQLAAGDYRWRLKARNLRGAGSWSSFLNFTVWGGPPGAAIPVSPSGDLFQATPYTPTYEWSPATDANGYQLQVEKDTVVLVNTTYDTSICSGTCSATPATGLAAGSYLWRVRATNPIGAGPWSAKLPFTVYDAIPDPPTLLYPLDDIYDTDPVYRWLHRPGASDYTFKLDAAANVELTVASVCSGGSCEYSASSLAVGAHTWQVRSRNDFGSSTWSSVTIDVLACSMPVDKDLPNPGTVTTTVEETACQDLQALAGYTIGSGGFVTFHAGSRVGLGNGFKVLSGGTFTTRVDE